MQRIMARVFARYAQERILTPTTPRPRHHQRLIFIVLLLAAAAAVPLAQRYVLPRLSSIRVLPTPQATIPLRADAGEAWLEKGNRATLEVLGNPAAQRYPDCAFAAARNPWDLRAYGGRLYIGLGNASNEGQSANAGPVPLMAYVPAPGRFVQETTLDEEEISRFYRIGPDLLIPGTDPRESWDWGNLYRRQQDGRWSQYRTLPRTIHAYALAQAEGRLLAGVSISDALPESVGTERHGSAVAVSEDHGRTWQLHPLSGWRIFDFLPVGGRLYATDLFPGPEFRRWLKKEGREAYHTPVHEYGSDRRFHRRPDLTAAVIFPDTPEARARAALVEQAIPWGEAAAYLGAVAARKGALPVRGLYIATNLASNPPNVHRVPLPEGAIPWDIRLEGEMLEVLLAQRLAPLRWRNSVWSSRDGKSWREVLNFEAVSFARSFERLGVEYYFGLGIVGEDNTCTAAERASGTLLRVRLGQGALSGIMDESSGQRL